MLRAVSMLHLHDLSNHISHVRYGSLRRIAKI